MARSPKGQMKEAQSGEGYRGGKQTAPDAGKSGRDGLQGDTKMKGQHTASWQTGSKLTIKRNG